MPYSIIYFLFFLSGLISLHYEVIWFKFLQYLFGSTVHSVSILLSSFMGGLSLGSYLIRKYLKNKNHFSLLIYAYLEIIIGLYALSFPFLFKLIQKIYPLISGNNQFFLSSLAINLVLSFLILALPTIAMGATLPALANFIISELDTSGKKLGILYFVNTLGAFTGSLTSSLFLIEHLGLNNLLAASSFVNLIIGFTSIVLYKSFYKKESSSIESQRSHSFPPIKLTETTKKILIIYSISGGISLAYEVLFTRLLSQITLNTVYAFAIMLSAFLLGIALGSFFISFFADKLNRICLSLAFLQFLLAFFSVFIMKFFAKLFHYSYKIDIFFHGNWILILSLKFFLFFFFLFPITLIFGALFPLFCKSIISSIQTLGREVGLVYFFNTTGAILGSLICGFILLPSFGSKSTSLIFITLNFLLAAYLLFLESNINKVFKFAFIILMFIAPHLVKNIIPNVIYEVSLSKITADEKLLFFKEGIDGNVMITLNKKKNNKVLYLNNEWIANTMAPGHMLFGHIPILLSPHPKNVLVVGLGSGITAKSTSLHPSIKKIDIVEISKTVVEASDFFLKDNNDILNNNKVKLYIDDVRHFLLKTNEKYDLILHEPLQQWTAGTVNLYTKDYYELCKSKLNKYGSITQWVQLNTLSISDLKMIIKTFRSSFPNSSAWLIGKELYLIGRKTPYRVSFEELIKNLPFSLAWKDISADSFNSPWQVFSPLDLFAFHFMNSSELNKIADSKVIITDDKPIMEYSVARSVSCTNQIEALNFLIKNKDCNIFPDHFIIKEASFKNRFLNICNSKRYIYLSLFSLENNNLLEAENYLEKALELSYSVASIQKLVSEIYLGLATKNSEKDLIQKYYFKALNACPTCYNALLKIGEVAQLNGNIMGAHYYYSEAMKNRPNLPEAYNHLAILYARDNFVLAKHFFRKAISLSRYNPDYYNNLKLLERLK